MTTRTTRRAAIQRAEAAGYELMDE